MPFGVWFLRLLDGVDVLRGTIEVHLCDRALLALKLCERFLVASCQGIGVSASGDGIEPLYEFVFRVSLHFVVIPVFGHALGPSLLSRDHPRVLLDQSVEGVEERGAELLGGEHLLDGGLSATARLQEAVATVDGAIADLRRNVYIPLILTTLSQQLRHLVVSSLRST